MPQPSTTSVDNSGDVSNDTTTTTPNTETDQQTVTDDNLDASKSTDTTDDGDKDQNTDVKEDTPAKFDEDLDDWITKRKLPKPENDEQKSEYQNLRNSQREFTREQQAKKDANDLSKAVKDAKTEVVTDDDDDDDTDPLEKRQNKIEAQLAAERETRLQSEFYSDNKVTPEEHKALLKVYKEETSRADTPEEKKADVEYWSNPKRLPTLLRMAKASLAEGVNPQVIADKAAQEERERIARESESKSPGRAATQTQDDSTDDINSDAARRKRFEARYNK